VQIPGVIGLELQWVIRLSLWETLFKAPRIASLNNLEGRFFLAVAGTVRVV
jgi:hypothetical protein